VERSHDQSVHRRPSAHRARALPVRGHDGTGEWQEGRRL